MAAHLAKSMKRPSDVNHIVIHGCLTALALLMLAAFVPTASADGITWDLSGVTFSDGATASGSFVFNADTNTFSSIDITVAGGSSTFGDGTYTILDPGYSSNSSRLVPVESPFPANGVGAPVLGFLFGSPLTDAGGTASLAMNQGIQDCANVNCSVSTITYDLTAGDVVSSVTATPEPSSLLMLVGGCLALGGMAFWRRRSAQPATAAAAS